jgi:predicted ArsR family transcriptional regulator
MDPDEIEEDVRAFLRTHIESYEQLEVLVAMHQARDVAWIAEEIAAKVRVPVMAATEVLDGLVLQGVLELSTRSPVPTYRLGSRDRARADLAARVARAYVERRLAVIKLMNANALERMRVSALARFSDAFLLGGKRDDD